MKPDLSAHHHPNPDASLLTPEEVAERIGVTPSTLAVWRSTGRVPLPYIKVGRRPMYDPKDVAAFIKHRRRDYPGFSREVD